MKKLYEMPKDMRELENGDRLIITNDWGVWIVKVTEVEKFERDGFIWETIKFTGMEDEGIDSFSAKCVDIALGVSPYCHTCIMEGSEFDIFSGIASYMSHCDSLLSAIHYNAKKIDESWYV